MKLYPQVKSDVPEIDHNTKNLFVTMKFRYLIN